MRYIIFIYREMFFYTATETRCRTTHTLDAVVYALIRCKAINFTSSYQAQHARGGLSAANRQCRYPILSQRTEFAACSVHSEWVTQRVQNLGGKWHVRHMPHKVSRECGHRHIGTLPQCVGNWVPEKQCVHARITSAQMPQRVARTCLWYWRRK